MQQSGPNRESQDKFALERRRQACVITSILSNLYIQDALENVQGFKINGHNLNNLHYVNDILYLGDTAKLQEMADTVMNVCKIYNMLVNVE